MTENESTARQFTIQSPTGPIEIVTVKPPVAYLGELEVEDVPDYLTHLAAVARMVDGFALYEGRRGNLERALQLIAMARADLATARGDILQVLGDCVDDRLQKEEE